MGVVFQMKAEIKTGVHIYSDTCFQLMYHLGTGGHIELEAVFHVTFEIETAAQINIETGFHFLHLQWGVRCSGEVHGGASVNFFLDAVIYRTAVWRNSNTIGFRFPKMFRNRRPNVFVLTAIQLRPGKNSIPYSEIRWNRGCSLPRDGVPKFRGKSINVKIDEIMTTLNGLESHSSIFDMKYGLEINPDWSQMDLNFLSQCIDYMELKKSSQVLINGQQYPMTPSWCHGILATIGGMLPWW